MPWRFLTAAEHRHLDGTFDDFMGGGPSLAISLARPPSPLFSAPPSLCSLLGAWPGLLEAVLAGLAWTA